MIGGRKHVVVILVVVKNWACLVNDDDDDDDAVSLQQYVLPVFILLRLNTHTVLIIFWLQSSRMFLSQQSS